jgi:glycerophosphoryl diester phosphodiesterase
MSSRSHDEPRRVADSLVRMARLMDPTDANAAPPLSRGRGGEEFRVPLAIVHGGVIMRIVDDAAGVCAARHVRGRVVTARVDSVNFLAPVFVGDLVTATAWVTAVGRTSLEVEVRVEAENLASGQVSHVATAHLVMVAIDRHGRPRAVPPLRLETDEERQRAAEARVRRALRQREIALVRHGRHGRAIAQQWRAPAAPPLIIGHRGAAGHAPENTLASFAKALALGADAVECDVQLSADGVPVVIHDPTLDRTTNGSGPVAARSAAELRALDAGAWFGPAFAGERIPTLAEVLDWARGRTRVVLELKQGPVYDARLPERVVEVIRDARAEGDVLAISFDHEAVRQVVAMAPAVLAGVLYAARPLDPVSLAWGAGATVLLPHWHFATADDVATAHEAGLGIAPWTVDDATVAERLFALGVDALSSNYPERLLAARTAAHGASAV